MPMQQSSVRSGRSPRIRARAILRPRAAALAVAALSAAVAVSARAESGNAASIALVGATVVGSDSGREIANAVVLISADRIVKVGPADSTPIPEGAKRVALTGKWLIPGLMNMHVH